MPTKRREKHSHINPRSCNSTYFFIVFITNFEDWSWSLINIIKVVKWVCIVKILVLCFRSLKGRKPRSIPMRWKVRSIFNNNFWFLRHTILLTRFFINNTPILVLKLSLGILASFLVFKFVVLLKIMGPICKSFDIVGLFVLCESLYY